MHIWSSVSFSGEIGISPVFKKVEELDEKYPGPAKSPDPDTKGIRGNISEKAIRSWLMRYLSVVL